MAVRYDNAHPGGIPIGPSCPAFADTVDGGVVSGSAEALSVAEARSADPTEGKKCRVCKQYRPLSMFSSRNGSYANVCDECRPSESTKLYGAAAKSREAAMARGTAKPIPTKPVTRKCRVCGETKPKAEFPATGINANLCHACREKQETESQKTKPRGRRHGTKVETADPALEASGPGEPSVGWKPAEHPLVSVVRSALDAGLDVKVTIGANKGTEG